MSSAEHHPLAPLRSLRVDDQGLHLSLAPEDAEEEERTPPVPPLEVDPADAAEQHRVVPLDDDDYR